MKNKRIILAILIIIWATIIFMFSHQPSEQSSNISIKTTNVLLKFIPNINQKESFFLELVEKINPIIRKLAHLSIYTIGGVLLLTFVNTFEISKNRKSYLALITGVLYAISDEIHQYFIPGRSCEIRDVLIDTLGLIIGILLSWLIIKKIEKTRKKKELEYKK